MIGLVFPSLAGPVTVHLVVSWPASAGGDAPGKPRKRARSNVIPPVLKDLRERAEEGLTITNLTRRLGIPAGWRAVSHCE